MTADDESDDKLYITWKKEQFLTRPRERENNDKNVNTEMSAMVNHFAKLDDSGVVKAMTDREIEDVRWRLQDRKSCPFRLRANTDDRPRSCTESASRDEKCG